LSIAKWSESGVTVKRRTRDELSGKGRSPCNYGGTRGWLSWTSDLKKRGSLDSSPGTVSHEKGKEKEKRLGI